MSAGRIEANKVIFQKLFSQDFWFVIPEYQRSYVWQTDNIIELVEDLYYAFENKDDSEIISQLIGLLSDENQKEVEQLLVDLVSNVEVDNMKIDFDKEFAENYDAFLLLVIQVIKLNYLESFQRLVTNLQSVLA